MNSSIGLAGGIIRDSQDPGASDVITAGGWLPTPKPMNGLFRDYEGLVLMAQRAFDPSARQKCDFRYKCHVCCFLRSWQAKSPLLQTHISQQKSQNKNKNWKLTGEKIENTWHLCRNWRFLRWNGIRGQIWNNSSGCNCRLDALRSLSPNGRKS